MASTTDSPFCNSAVEHWCGPLGSETVVTQESVACDWKVWSSETSWTGISSRTFNLTTAVECWSMGRQETKEMGSLCRVVAKAAETCAGGRPPGILPSMGKDRRVLGTSVTVAEVSEARETLEMHLRGWTLALTMTQTE